MSASDRQVGGSHYQSMKIDIWEFLEANLSQEEFSGYLKGSTLKYLMREKNDSLEDLLKAQHFLEKLIEISDKPEPVRGAFGNL